jgi:hypothetical protein
MVLIFYFLSKIAILVSYIQSKYVLVLIDGNDINHLPWTIDKVLIIDFI